MLKFKERRTKMIKMNRNTSPISPFQPDHIRRALEKTQVNQYPGAELDRFKENYSRLTGLPSDQIAVANGSDEWVKRLIRYFGRQGTILTFYPDFIMYFKYASQYQVDLRSIPADDNFDFHIDQALDRIQEVKPKLFIFSSPNNSTGKQFSQTEIQALADRMKEIGGYLVIDEAYIEFGQDYKRPTGSHVLILRTMSKMYGMAGLRLGILYGKGDIFDQVTGLGKSPFPISHLNLNLASEFMEDTNHLKDFINYQLESRKTLVETMAKVKNLVNIKETAANFTFTYGSKAQDLARYLGQKGYVIGSFDDDPLKQAFRYSIIQNKNYPRLAMDLEEWKAGNV